MTTKRAQLFDEVPDPDLARFTPKASRSAAPPIEQVRDVAQAAGFPTREAKRVAPIAERHYYRTGRDTQFNTKVRPDVKNRFVAIATEDGVPLGKVLEDALDALERQRRGR
ncbi:stability/partitioning determinant [Rhodopila globiformis]|uniref:Stability/partitioning determinant n=1 Tax=Rhodopila globiformis TaxID=1071 RepID=A0A2S6NBF7_RHOGL|nr:stability/partitioning determinant [Rhodopila globiformis]PPQ31924.1 hypothetical protein CCS01_16250 [Rhodopila globiformis]